MKNHHRSIACIALAAALIAFIPVDAFAQSGGLAQTGKNIREGLAAFPQIVAIMAQIGGFFWALMAAMALRKAGAEDDRDPQQMKKALFNLIAGVMAVGIPAALGMGATTLFGDTSGVLKGDNPTINIR